MNFRHQPRDFFLVAGSALIGGALVFFLQYFSLRRVPGPSIRGRDSDEVDEDDDNTPPAKPPVRCVSPPENPGFADSFIKDHKRRTGRGAAPSPKAASSPANFALPEGAAVFPVQLPLPDLPPAALVAATASKGCGLVGWGNNEDGQLSPAPESSGCGGTRGVSDGSSPLTAATAAGAMSGPGQRIVAPSTRPGLSPRIVATPAPSSPSGGHPAHLMGDKVELPRVLNHFGGRGRKVVGVSCGSRHTLAVTSDGLVFAWGWSALGQLAELTQDDHGDGIDHFDGNQGLPPPPPSSAGPAQKGGCSIFGGAPSPAAAAAAAAAAAGVGGLGSRGRSGSFGFGNMSCDDDNGDNVKASAFSSSSSSSLLRGGSAGAGSDRKYVLRPIAALAAVVGEEGPCVEVAAGGMHSAARFASGHVYTWGMSTFGQLGRGGSEVVGAKSVSKPGLVTLPPPSQRGVQEQTHREQESGVPLVAAQISCGGMHSMAVGPEGELFAWGRADSGQLGVGRAWMETTTKTSAMENKGPGPPWALPSLSPPSSSSSSSSSPSSSFVSADGNSKGVCWPTRVDFFDSSQDPIVQVACGAFHTCAVTKAGQLFSWGREEFGCLGVHFTEERMVSGVYLPQKVELPSAVGRVRSVACGGAHTLAVDTAGVAVSCGKNEHGRLGLGDGKPNCLTFEVVKALQDAQVKVCRVAAGGSHSLFLADTGKVYASGRLSLGRLGVPAGSSDPISGRPVDDNKGLSVPALVLTAADNTADDDGDEDGSGGGGGGGGGRRVVAMSAGGQHSCVIVG